MQVLNLGMPTFNQSLPGGQGARRMQDLFAQHLMNQAREQQNQVAPQLAQSLLQQRAMQNQLSQARLPLLNAQAQSAQYQADHADDFLDLKKLQADIARRSVEAREAYNKLQYDKLPYFASNAATRASSSLPGKAVIANDPQAASNYARAAKGAGQYADEVINRNRAPQGAQQGFVGVNPVGEMQDQNGFAPPPAQQVSNNQQAAPLDPQATALQIAAQSSLAKDTTPSNVQNQRYRVRTVNHYLDEYDKALPVVAQFFGLEGRTKLGEESLRAALGSPSDAYKTYLNFIETIVPNLTGESVPLYKLPSTNESVKKMQDTYLGSMWATTPKAWLARARYQSQQVRKTAKAYEKGLGQVGFTDAQNQQDQLGNAMRNEQSSEMATIQGPDGQNYFIPQNQVSAAIAAGGRRVR